MPPTQLRSRTGCFRCKKRRVKCDERHPRCTACTKWNFVCLWPAVSSQTKAAGPSPRDARAKVDVIGNQTDGVIQERQHDRRERGKQKHVSIHSTDRRLVEHSRPEIPVYHYKPYWNFEEYQAFSFFESQTSNNMTGVFRIEGEVEIWSRMLLQGVHDSPEIKHAICAIGALHRHLGCESNDDSGDVYLLAARQYNKSIQCTMRSTFHKRMSVDEILTMCILFTLLERLLGDVQTAVSHLQAGIKLLAGDASGASKLTQRLKSPGRASCVPRATIVTLLRRLERQMYELGQTRLQTDPAEAFAFNIDIPIAFANLGDASRSFEHYFNEAMQLMHTCEWKEEEQRQAQKPVEPDLVSLLRRVLLKWTRAFKSFLQDARLDDGQPNGPERLMVETLQLNRYVLVPSLAHYQTGDDMICDNYISEYTEAVAHGAAIVRSLKSEKARDHAGGVTDPSPIASTSPSSIPTLPCNPVPATHPPPGTSQRFNLKRPGNFILTFSPFNPISALFTTGWRCRDPTIRRRAIELLQDIDWYDAFWDSKISSKVAERICQIEEFEYLLGRGHTGHSSAVERAEDVLPTARVSQIRVQFDKPHLFVCEFMSINANNWVPGPGYWDKPLPDSFHEVGKIRETWVVDNYRVQDASRSA